MRKIIPLTYFPVSARARIKARMHSHKNSFPYKIRPACIGFASGDYAQHLCRSIFIWVISSQNSEKIVQTPLHHLSTIIVEILGLTRDSRNFFWVPLECPAHNFYTIFPAKRVVFSKSVTVQDRHVSNKVVFLAFDQDGAVPSGGFRCGCFAVLNLGPGIPADLVTELCSDA